MAAAKRPPAPRYAFSASGQRGGVCVLRAVGDPPPTPRIPTESLPTPLRVPSLGGPPGPGSPNGTPATRSPGRSQLRPTCQRSAGKEKAGTPRDRLVDGSCAPSPRDRTRSPTVAQPVRGGPGVLISGLRICRVLVCQPPLSLHTFPTVGAPPAWLSRTLPTGAYLPDGPGARRIPRRVENPVNRH